MESFDTLSEAIVAKQKQGYVLDFNLKSSGLFCPELSKNLTSEEFFVDEFYRFEGDSNPDDSSILYVISTTCGLKGLLVSAYGLYTSLSSEMLERLKWKA